MAMRVSRMTMVAFASLAVGCAGSTGGGCGGGAVEPIPGGFSGQKKPNAAVVRISQQGFDYLNANWLRLVTRMMPGAAVSPENPNHLELAFALPCMDMGTVPVVSGGNLFVCDNGQGGPGTAGFMDGACTGSDSPCPIMVTIERVVLSPASPDKIEVEADVRIDALKDPITRETSSLFVDSADNSPVCFGTKKVGCFANYHSAGRGTRDDEALAATVKFALEQNWDGQLTFALTAPDPSAPESLIGGLDSVEGEDIEIHGCNESSVCNQEDWCDWACSAANLSFLKDLLIDSVVKPQLQGAIKEALDKARCRACNPSDPLVASCPGEGVDSFCKCLDGGNTCEDEAKVCMSSAARGGACVPPLLGAEQYVNLGALLASFGGDPAARLETFVAAGGGGLTIDSSLQVGMLGGAKAQRRAACVPERPAPTPRNPATPNLAALGPAGHHVGLAISGDFLNQAMWEAHRSGAACLNIGTAQAAPLTTGLFKTFLPSLGTVAGSESADAPMMIALRPLEAPVVHVGEGSFDATTGDPIKPLVTLELKDLRIDFYALIEGRYARLFTLGADFKLPLSLLVEGCPSTLLPAFGDLSSLITIRPDVPANSEILAEDPQALAQLVPMALGMAEPALAAILKPTALPELNGFRLQVDALKGIGRIGTSDDFDFLGAFATLGVAGQCESWGPRTIARMIERRVPPRELMRLEPGRALPQPSARIEVSAEDLPGQARAMEFAWRVDGGLWSTWRKGPELEVSHAALTLPGKHVIEVRARVAGEGALVDPTPEALEMLVDWDGPELSLSVDRSANRIAVAARDAVSPPEALRWSYRLGAGAPSEFGPAREIDLAAVEAAGGLEVSAQDEAGNVSTARWGLEAFAAEAGNAGRGTQAAQAEAPASGCSSAGAGLAGLFALALVPFALRRRRD